MYNAPDYKNRDPKEIMGENIYFDSIGHIYRAMSWLDYFERMNQFPSLLYSCIEARMGIEQMLFEEIVLSTGFQLDRNGYERCLKSRMKFGKLIRQLSPDYEKLQQFTRVVLELTGMGTDEPVPQLVFWKTRELEEAWGRLSRFLHWPGAPTETTDDPDWINNSYRDIKNTLLPIWERMSSGPTGILHHNDMKPKVHDIWTDFRNEKIGIDSVRWHLKLICPIL